MHLAYVATEKMFEKYLLRTELHLALTNRTREIVGLHRSWRSGSFSFQMTFHMTDQASLVIVFRSAEFAGVPVFVRRQPKSTFGVPYVIAQRFLRM